MLLPSDIARLVLGYLQQEGLTSTSKEFIHESPNLREYAEHSTEDGTIPACPFSLFGKSLSTILNEYVAAKAKETSQEIPIPPIMTSLWKKLEFTLNQIKSLQNSPTIGHNHRLRVRNANALANLRRQGALVQSASPSFQSPSASPAPHESLTIPIPSPLITTLGIPGHSTPLNYTSPQPRPSSICSTPAQMQTDGRLLVNMKDAPIHVMVPDNRLNPGPVSPGRRKWDSPRRRGGGLSGTGRSNMATSSLAAEPQNEEAVTENFPQMVIQSAREKILGDRSLQEKLAENINKILSSDSSPQASKASCSTLVPDQSIDEILGLQGEIHMSDDAIHDILEQTESDPAFQALFDLFDCGKSKASEGTDLAAGVESSSTVDSIQTGETGCVDNTPNFTNQGIVNDDALSNVTQETMLITTKAKPGQEAKNKRKSAPPSASKTPLGSHISRLRKGTSPTRLQAADRPAEASVAAPLGDSLFCHDEAAMDVDEPGVDAASEGSALQEVCETVRQRSTPTSTTSTGTFSPSCVGGSDAGTATSTPKGNKMGQAQESKGLTPAGSALLLKTTPKILPFHLASVPPMSSFTPLLAQWNKVPKPKANVPHVNMVPPPNSADISQAPPQAAPSTPVPTPATATSVAPSSTGTTDTMDPSKIVSLKIIISDEQEEASGDTALNQAVSSISGDKIPTIFLSSPTKSPAKAPPALPGTPVAQDETAQAVSSLQSTEVFPSLSSPRAGGLALASMAGATPLKDGVQQQVTQPSYIIQLPLDSASSNFGGATTSYFLVTDASAAGPQAGKMVLSSGIPPRTPGTPGSCSLATPPRPKTFTTGSTLYISPVRPMVQSMMVPVSVMGQNNTGNVSMLTNQIIALPAQAPVPVLEKQPETGKPKETAVPGKTIATGSNAVPIGVQPPSSEKTAAAGTSPSHRRILCFDGSTGSWSPTQPRKTTASTTTALSKAPEANTALSTSPSQQAVTDTPKQARVKPAILGGSRPKRRIETVRCPDNTQTSWGAAETERPSTLQQQEKEAGKSTHSKTVCNQDASSGGSHAETSPPETSKKSESRRRSKSTDKKDEGRRRLSDSPSTRSSSSDHRLRSGSRREREEESKQEPCDKGSVKGRDGRTEKQTPTQEPPVTANKENEVEGRRHEPQPTSTPSPRDIGPLPVTPPTPTLQALPSKSSSKTSPLTKHAAEMLQDIQGLQPPSTPVRRLAGMGCPDLPLPRTPGSGRLQDESLDCPRTPVRQRHLRDGEGTPRHLVPPVTPDLPSCSPASEAGSENSINMAAHTLMILSRAAIARTGTPLKDSLRQEGAGSKTPVSSKNKKRKQPEPQVSPPSKKELKASASSGSRKKAKKQKKLLDSFPDDLDVDKFLSSLHYDE